MPGPKGAARVRTITVAVWQLELTRLLRCHKSGVEYRQKNVYP